MTSLPFSYTLESGTSIEMLLNRDVIKSINNFFLQETHFRVQPLSVPRNVCTFDLCSMYSSCPIYWVEHCTAKAVPVRMEILFRGTCRFLFFFIFIVFLTFFLEGSFLFRVCTKIKNNIKCLRIPVFFTSLH